MPTDDLNADEDDSFEPLGVHEGADELPRRNYSIDHEIVMKTVATTDTEVAAFPDDESLDEVVEETRSKWIEESFSYHWVDQDELWAWHNDESIDRLNPEYRRIMIVCKVNSKYRTHEDGSLAEWLRALSSQTNIGTAKRLITKASNSLNQIDREVHGHSGDEFDLIDFSHINAIPQDQTPIWQEFLMDRDNWLDDYGIEE